MGRRKKEPQSVHRQAISAAAQQLFMQKGIDATSMDEIAKLAGYSKATLYVYFENKEAIIGMLVLESMQKLHDYLSAALEKQASTREKYHLLCYGLVQYQEEFPYYFKTALEQINIDFENAPYLPEEQETYRVGEQINATVEQFLRTGIAQGDIRADLQILPTIFAFWGMLSGFIQMAANKQAYIEKALKRSKQQFLAHGFDTLYRSIACKEETGGMAYDND